MAKKPRLEWAGTKAILFRDDDNSRQRINPLSYRTLFARIQSTDLGASYQVLTNDFDTTGTQFETYEGARGYILALYALID